MHLFSYLQEDYLKEFIKSIFEEGDVLSEKINQRSFNRIFDNIRINSCV